MAEWKLLTKEKTNVRTNKTTGIESMVPAAFSSRIICKGHRSRLPLWRGLYSWRPKASTGNSLRQPRASPKLHKVMALNILTHLRILRKIAYPFQRDVLPFKITTRCSSWYVAIWGKCRTGTASPRKGRAGFFFEGPAISLNIIIPLSGTPHILHSYPIVPIIPPGN